MHIQLAIPLALIAISSLAIVVIAWRKLPQLKRLPLENTNGNGSFVAGFFPEVTGFFRKLNLGGYKNKVLKETEKALRAVRVVSLKMDSATNGMIHKIRKNGSSEQVNNDNEEVIDLQAEEEKLITAISEEPKNPVLYKRLGLLYSEMGNHNDAIEAFRVCLELDPADIEAQVKLKEARSFLNK